jgi:hypothetical protein
VKQQGSKKAKIRADPHITVIGGGKFDFRGEDMKIFALWAAAGFQVNAMTKSCLFKTKKGHVIDGTFFTRAYLKLGSKVHAEVRAEQPGSFRVYASDDAEGTYANRTLAKADASYIVVTPKKELVASVDGVEVRVGWKQVYMPLDVNEKPVAKGHPSRWYLDTSFKVLNATMPAVAPHGLIGQSFDGSPYTVHGKRDRHGHSHYFKTAAQGEGAIEGAHTDYIVPAPFATSFKFARFGVKGRVAPRDVKRLTGRKEVRKGYDVAIGSAGGYVEDDANEANE